MKTNFIRLCVVIPLLNVTTLLACGLSPEFYSSAVLSTNSATASNAVVMLRRLGNEGLKALLKTHEQLLAKHDDQDPQWQRLRAALDAVGGQRDCYASHLFWHTNFDEAKAEAKRTGKPILSLRLLGNLNEELSCANSRFFRTTLYANREVSDYLRDHFVLHWKSVRPVPHITIDFGDGRKMERTITGNSIHYVLDSNGEVVDAIPGLYGARAFLDVLKTAEPFARESAKSQPARAKMLERFHVARLNDINQCWSADLRQVGFKERPIEIGPSALATPTTPAAAAMPLAVGKAAVEWPMLRAVTPRREALERSMDDQMWTKIAALHTNDVVLDNNAVALIRAKEQLRADMPKRGQFLAAQSSDMFSALERSIAEDTVRNEYLMHAKLHEWLGAPSASFQVDALNSRVYAELFLTPESDPWLGLAPQNAFSALENGGLSAK